MTPLQVIVLLSLSLIILISIMVVVRNQAYPPPKNWIEVDCDVESKSLFNHFKDCGLLYPVLFIYIVYGLFLFLEWKDKVSVT